MNVIEILNELVASICGIDKNNLSEETKVDDSGVTSIALIEIIAEMEDKYDIELGIDDMDVYQYKTLGDLYQAYERAISEK